MEKEQRTDNSKCIHAAEPIHQEKPSEIKNLFRRTPGILVIDLVIMGFAAL